MIFFVFLFLKKNTSFIFKNKQCVNKLLVFCVLFLLFNNNNNNNLVIVLNLSIDGVTCLWLICSLCEFTLREMVLFKNTTCYEKS